MSQVFAKVAALPLAIKQYLMITANYWAFTLTDGALRMLVLLHFHQLGYSPFALASLFIFYEVFGVVTNLLGGWLGARIGLNRTMNIGLALQVLALLMLALEPEYLTLVWVMAAQALSGIAKDLNKMSAKSSIKTLVPNEQQGVLFRWVALLTGSKNALKGVGFFLGALLLALLGFQVAVLSMAAVLAIVALLSVVFLNQSIGKTKNKIKFTEIFSKSSALNYLSAARLCLFAARDVWFVVALPVFLHSQLSWSFHFVGAFMALWIVFYGMVQVNAPALMAIFKQSSKQSSKTLVSNVLLVRYWGAVLAVVTLLLVLALGIFSQTEIVIVVGLFAFGFVFAVNSSLHSYLIVALAKDDAVSLDVGFYYMANALGRLLGTLLSGWLYQAYNLSVCLMVSAALASLSVVFIRYLGRK